MSNTYKRGLWLLLALCFLGAIIANTLTQYEAAACSAIHSGR